MDQKTEAQPDISVSQWILVVFRWSPGMALSWLSPGRAWYCRFKTPTVQYARLEKWATAQLTSLFSNTHLSFTGSKRSTQRSHNTLHCDTVAMVFVVISFLIVVHRSTRALLLADLLRDWNIGFPLICILPASMSHLCDKKFHAATRTVSPRH